MNKLMRGMIAIMVMMAMTTTGAAMAAADCGCNELDWQPRAVSNYDDMEKVAYDDHDNDMDHDEDKDKKDDQKDMEQQRIDQDPTRVQPRAEVEKRSFWDRDEIKPREEKYPDQLTQGKQHRQQERDLDRTQLREDTADCPYADDDDDMDDKDYDDDMDDDDHMDHDHDEMME